MAISPLFSIGQRALLANEVALDVTGGNIANVNTPGYTRQIAEVAADPPVGGTFGGSGAHVAAVTQVLDPLLQGRLLAAETDRRGDAERRDQLSALAGQLNDLDTPSLSSTLAGFFDAADALARNPAGLAERQALLARATAVAAELNRRHAAVAGLQRAIDGSYVDSVTHANDTLRAIGDLNRAITAAGASDASANELRDQRRQALADLAGIVGVSTVEDAHGVVTVSARNGLVLVDGSGVVNPIAVRAAGVGLDGLPLHEAGTVDAGGAFVGVPGAYASGVLGTLADVRDGALVTAARNLDTLAVSLRDQVNAIQTDRSARDLDGNPTSAAPLFGGSGAADLTVALADPRRLATALSADQADNRNALRLADLRSARVALLGNQPFDAYLAAGQAALGEDAARATDAAAASAALATQLENQRSALSGVNLNEELANLLKYQRAFQAAAQVIKVADAALAGLLDAV